MRVVVGWYEARHERGDREHDTDEHQREQIPALRAVNERHEHPGEPYRQHKADG